MALEIDDAELVGADGQVHTDAGAFGEHVTAGRLELFARDIVVARVRRVEAGVDVAQQRMLAASMTLCCRRPSAFAADALPIEAVIVFDQRVRGEAGTEYGRDVVFRPTHDIDQRIPERFLIQRRVDDVGAGDDQCIETLFGQLLKVEVVFAICASALRRRA